MKPIYNYKNATVFDIEADGLLFEATKVHTLCFKMLGKEIKPLHGVKEMDRVKGFFKYHIDNNIPVVAHNGISYDVPLIEKLLGMDLSKLMVIDTLALSWYLNHNRKIHGLDSFFEDYGIAKPVVADGEWKCESEDPKEIEAHYQKMRHRCIEDVKINVALYEDLIQRLEDMYSISKVEIDVGSVGGTRISKGEEIYLDRMKGDSVEDYVNRILTFLCFKMDCARLQEKTMWEVDVPYLQESEATLLGLTETAAKELESVMPPVAKYTSRKQPSKPFKINGELSVSGERWDTLKKLLISEEVDEYGNQRAKVIKQGEIHELISYEPPNIGSVQQVKDFLLSKGWVPETFKYVRDKEAFEEWINEKPITGSARGAWTYWKNTKPVDREVAQISIEGEEGKELCPSVLRLAEEVPEIKALENYSMIKHRLGIVQGFLKNLKQGKYLQARIGGFTNTLRVKHTEVVNLPAANKPFAEVVRGCLIAGEGKISLGSDLSGIEDRVKHNFMIPHDPEYVKDMMAPDYDPHIATALASGTITKEEAKGYKLKTLPQAVMDAIKSKRAVGKTVNYASVYGAGAAKIALTAGISVEEAQQALDGYWKLNWSVEAIADEQVVITCAKGFRWLINPINGFLYSLRSDKDKFSTLAQGTGSYLFDMWVDAFLDKLEAKWKKKTLTGSFHDEMIVVVKNDEKVVATVEEMLYTSIKEVSDKYLMRRALGCDVQTGQRYSDIH